MSQCKYHEYCGRDVEDNSVEGLCILHSTDPAKDTHAFAEALADHRAQNGDNFVRFVFPGEADFSRAIFSKDASFSRVTFTKLAQFSGATFSGEAHFYETTFSEGAVFGNAMFTKVANFGEATFSEGAIFGGATFSKDALFTKATFMKYSSFDEATFREEAWFARGTFSGWASFFRATFHERVIFIGAMFLKEAVFNGATSIKKADFGQATFSGKTDFIGTRFSGRTDFRRATFSGRTLFAPLRGGVDAGDISAGTEVNFRQVVINPPDTMTFQEADLTRWRFLDTDLRKVQLFGVTWPRKRWRWRRKGGRTIVYDEIAPVESEDDGNTRPWPKIERLYRELKQNYEDRRDYERAGDFHYGEKEMRWQSPATARGLHFFLWLYWLFSGYGEHILLPLFWAGLLFVGSTMGYMWWGLRPKDGQSTLAWTNFYDWGHAAHYSFRVMTLLKPDDWKPQGLGQVLNTVQTLLGPTFLGLFALALRQRLKR